METLVSPPFQPFMIAAVVLFGLIVIEVLSLLIGASVSGMLEGLSGVKALEDVDFFGSGLGWLNVGKVPLLVLLVLILATFAAFGLVIQTVASAFAAPLPPWIASLGALAFAIPTTRGVSRLVAAIIPKDETYATETDHFVGRTGVISLGPAKAGSVARMKIKDQWNNWHFPRVRPADPDDVIEQGESVLVVDTDGQELLIARAGEDLLPDPPTEPH